MMLELPRGPLMIDVDGLLLAKDDLRRLCHPAVGGVILFARNYQDRQQLLSLTAAIHGLRSPQLLIAVDQEGGRVQRFREPFVSLPAARSLGRYYDINPQDALQQAFHLGWVMAYELRDVGIDFSFAPVLDLALVPSTVIGDRSLHHDPTIAAQLAESLCRGMQTAGMACTGKHFPGHGGVQADSHSSQPVDERNLTALENNDFVPYCQLIRRHLLEGVMIAHVLYPNIDKMLPTYSSFWLQSVIRTQLAFDGMLFSDDLAMVGAMAGAADAGAAEQRVRRALSAGCDVALFCNQPEEVDRILGSTTIRNLPYNELLSRRWQAMQPQVDCDPAVTRSSEEWHLACAGLQALAS